MTGETPDYAKLLRAATWRPSEPATSKDLASLPPALAALLKASNGLILSDGMLHVRGVCSEPLWHSLDHVWRGPLALSAVYRSISAADVPFAQDAFGDQYLLRGQEVWRLSAEADTISLHSPTLPAFFDYVLADAARALNLEIPIAPLKGRKLLPGQLINVYPPFMFKTDSDYSMRPIPTLEQLAFLMDIVRQCRDLPEGAKVTFRVAP